MGKGAFGQVFTGSSVIDGKRVAIKKIKRENRKDQELQIMKKKINHQNIVKYLADDLTELHCYIVMEKCDGNLLELLQAFGGKFSKEIDLQSAVSQIVTGYEVIFILQGNLSTFSGNFTLLPRFCTWLKLYIEISSLKIFFT